MNILYNKDVCMYYIKVNEGIPKSVAIADPAATVRDIIQTCHTSEYWVAADGNHSTMHFTHKREAGRYLLI